MVNKQPLLDPPTVTKAIGTAIDDPIVYLGSFKLVLVERRVMAMQRV